MIPAYNTGCMHFRGVGHDLTLAHPSRRMQVSKTSECARECAKYFNCTAFSIDAKKHCKTGQDVTTVHENGSDLFISN